MRKNRAFYTLVTLLTLALLIFSGCQVSNLGESDSQALEVEMVGETESSRTSKVVTDYDTKEVLGSTANVSEVIQKAFAGGYTKYYNKNGYTGTLISTGGYQEGEPEPAGGLGSLSYVNITYKGTVTLQLPLTKSVTVYDNMTFYNITESEFNDIINKIYLGRYTKYYNKDGYTGTLISTYYDANNPPIKIGEGERYYYFSPRITYKGIVKLKL